MLPKLRILALLGASLTSSAVAQIQSTPPPRVGIPAAIPAAPAFEVVSIRPTQPDGPRVSGPAILPDGYRISTSIWLAIQTAYFPNQWNWMDRIKGAPSWLMSDRYDITAKVSNADLSEWMRQKDLKPEQRVLLQQMLQSMLAERCKLVVHRIPTTISGFALVVGKHGPHLTPSTPGTALAVGMKLSDGGVLVPRKRGGPSELHIYNATMADLASVLNPGVDAHPIVEKTGLTGHFDIVLPYDYDPANGTDEHWHLETLGLRLEPVAIPFISLVIDHVEKPAEN